MATWRNWTGDEGCAPARIVRPGSEAELAAAVAAASARDDVVRAVGSGHSFTDLACTDGTLIDVGALAGLRAVDAETGRVTVGAGTTLRDLGPQLAAHGLALENQGDIDAQTLAGAVATGTHGTGARWRNLSASVVGLRLVTAAGDVLELGAARAGDRADPDGGPRPHGAARGDDRAQTGGPSHPHDDRARTGGPSHPHDDRARTGGPSHARDAPPRTADPSHPHGNRARPGGAPDADADALRAARVALGALGVVSELTIQAVPRYTLVRHDEPRPLAETLDGLDALVDGHDHAEFWVFPYTRTALVRTLRRTPELPGPPTARLRRRVQEDLIENAALGAVCRAGRAVPRLVPRANRLISGALSANTVTDLSHRIYASRRAVRFTEMEYAIPRAAARDAVERVLALIHARRLPILFPLEVRFAAPDDALLSTAAGRPTAYVAVHQYAGMAYEGYFRAVEAIMDEHGGRPHWGKRHYQRAATLAPRYPGWERFQAVRDRLDPGRTFANDHVRRVLG